jgi:competence protein ComEC
LSAVAVTSDSDLHAYMLSVGQADTTIIVSPQGNLTIIDAKQPEKILSLLRGLGCDGAIEHLVITHPHDDHFSGANRLVGELTVGEATLAPFWHSLGMGPPTYCALVGRFADKKTKVTFLSGYGRWYPDGLVDPASAGPGATIDVALPFLELLGPTNGLVRQLEDSNVFTANHLSIMGRLTWGSFRMIVSADAQMENWAYFDQERMLEEKCQVLRAAHHGSRNGTQSERLERLTPSKVIISSDPASGHQLPDLCGAATFATYARDSSRVVAVTRDTGTVHLRVGKDGRQTLTMFGDEPTEAIDTSREKPLTAGSNPTDWQALLSTRVGAL